MSRHHHIHILLSLTLFLLFVLGSFFVVAYEIKGYQKLNEQCLLEDDLNIPLAYLNTKLKAMDEKGAISVVSIQKMFENGYYENSNLYILSQWILEGIIYRFRLSSFFR